MMSKESNMGPTLEDDVEGSLHRVGTPEVECVKWSKRVVNKYKPHGEEGLENSVHLSGDNISVIEGTYKAVPFWVTVRVFANSMRLIMKISYHIQDVVDVYYLVEDIKSNNHPDFKELHVNTSQYRNKYGKNVGVLNKFDLQIFGKMEELINNILEGQRVEK